MVRKKPPKKKAAPNLKQLWYIAYHEAGHVTACLRLGIGIGRAGVSIVADGGGGFTASHRGFRGNPEVGDTDRRRSRIEKNVVMILAGTAAQRKFRPSSVRRMHGSSDRNQAINLLGCLVGSDQELDAWLKLLRIRAEHLVENAFNWKVIEAVAAALMERKRLGAKDVKDISLRMRFPNGPPIVQEPGRPPHLKQKSQPETR
jgi:hypothetical protein